MPIIHYHKEKVELFRGRVKSSELIKLEKNLIDLGWSNLIWSPCPPENKEGDSLAGLPPNYHGDMGNYYYEDVAYTLKSLEKPYLELDEICVRNYLNGPIFESPKGKDTWTD